MTNGVHTAPKENSRALKAVVRDGWALCPRCWGKLCRVQPGASARGIRLWCKRDREVELTIEP